MQINLLVSKVPFIEVVKVSIALMDLEKSLASINFDAIEFEVYSAKAGFSRGNCIYL